MVQRLEHGGKSGGFDYYLTGSQRQSDGNRANSDGKVRDLYGRLGYKFNDKFDGTFQVTHSDGLVDDPGIENSPPKPIVERFDSDNELYIAALSHKQGIAEGSAKFYYENGKIDWQQWDGTASEQFNTITDYQNYGIRIRETFTFSGGHEIITGIDHDVYGGMTREKRPLGDKNCKNIFFYNTAPYVMVSGKYGNKTTIAPSFGVRYNVSRYFGNQVGAQAGVTMSHNDTKVYANAARAYNLPGVYAAVQYDTSWSFNGANTGKWKDLKPELLDHYEIGLHRLFTENLNGALSCYYENVTDALRFVSPPPPPPHYANTGAYTVRGVEASLSYNPIKNLDLFGGASLMNTTPKEVPNAPETTMSAGANYTAFRKLRISLDAQYVNEQYILNPRYSTVQQKVDSYTLLNSRIGWFVPSGERVGEIFFAIENITNKPYEYRPGYPMPGRTFMIGLDVRI
jgi:outer membrane cobalamin receptor